MHPFTDDILAFCLALFLHALGFFLLGFFLTARQAEATPPILDVSSVELTLADSPDPGEPPPSAASEAADENPTPPEPEPPKPLPPPDPVVVQAPTPSAVVIPKLPDPPDIPPPELPDIPPPELPPLPSAAEKAPAKESPAQAHRQGNPSAASAASSSARNGRGDAGATGAIVAPVSRDRVIKPHYPQGARRRGEEGTVVLDVRVGTDGMPSSVALVKSSGYAELDAAALRAAQKSRFRPGTRNHVPVEATARLPITFRLTDE